MYREMEIEKREKKVAHLEVVNDKYIEEVSKNSTLNAKNSTLSARVSEQSAEIVNLKAQIANIPNKIKEATQGIQEKLELAWQVVKTTAQAVNTLQYGNDDLKKYKIEEPTTEQGRLMTAITNYTAYWAERDGFSSIAKEIKSKFGLSEGVRNHVQELEPKQKKISHERG